ncbi:hypothetical protein BJ996_007170 [Streptomyces phaeogriseichromatogenes]|nr:hypothetical protein [Streptomyces murinus]
MAVLTVDADGEVAQAGHDARELAGMDLGVLLAERPVADVVRKVSDLPAPSDPVGELGAGDRAGRQVGDQIDALDGELAAREVLPPTDDLEDLTCVGVVVEVSEGGGLQPSDLQAVMGPGAVAVVERDLAPGQTADAVEGAGMVGIVLGDVVGTALSEVGAVGVLGVQGVGGDDRAGQVDAVERGPEGADLVALSATWRGART